MDGSDVSRSRRHGPATSLVPARPSSCERSSGREAGAPLAGLERRAPLDLLLLEPLRHLVVVGKTGSAPAVSSSVAVSRRFGDGQRSACPGATPVARRVLDEEGEGLLVGRRSGLHDAAAARSHHSSGRSGARGACGARRIVSVINNEKKSRQTAQHGPLAKGDRHTLCKVARG